MVYYKPEQPSGLRRFFSPEKLTYFLLAFAGILIAAFIYSNYLWQKSLSLIDKEVTRAEQAERELKELREKQKLATGEKADYVNSEKGYKLAYPKLWDVREEDDHVTFEPPPQIPAGEKTPSLPGLFFVTVRDNPKNFDIQSWLDQDDEAAAGLGSFDRFLSRKEAGELKKLYEADKAFRLDYYEKEFAFGEIAGLEQYLDSEGGSARVVYIPFGGKMYVLTVTSERHFDPGRHDPAIADFLEITGQMINSFELLKK